MSELKQKKYCKLCVNHWTKGIKDGKHDNWCCKVGQPAKTAIGHCLNHQLRFESNDYK